MAGLVHFQIKRDQKIYKIDLEPIDVWSPDEVLINGHRYRISGDFESVSWLRQHIPQFLSHADISLEALKAKLLEVGAKNIRVAGKTHAIGMKHFTKKSIDEIQIEHEKLQKKILRSQNHIARLEQQLRSKGARRNKASFSQQMVYEKQRVAELKKTLEKSKNALVDFYHLRLEEKTNKRISLQTEHGDPNAVMQAKAAEMTAYLQYMQAKKHFRGAVLIQDHGEPILRAAYGPKNASGTPNTPETRFCIASMTKQFTGAAIALLIQRPELITDPNIRGTLSLKSPINDLLPEKYRDAKWNGIVLEHLLRHTSGIPSYGGSPKDERRKENFTLDELITMVKKHDLLFDPGEMWSYSNSGYVLLGAIIENLSGQTLETFLHNQIFTPCHMDHTGMISSYDRESVAAGFDQLQIVPTERHLSKPYAAGGMISTVDDLGKWDRALYGIDPLSDATKRLMLTCPTPVKAYDPRNAHLHYAFDKKTKRHHLLPNQQYREVRYGFGIVLEKRADIGHGNYGDILFHDGALPGFSSWMARYIPSQRSVILLCNTEDTPMKEEVQWHLEDILFA
jgi:CubicO group peptidase (beta-lactamase class C family)